MRTIYARDFFDLQFAFAEAARDLSDRSLEEALLDYTNFYVRFGFGREFDPANQGWTRYLSGLRAAADPREWTYGYYLRDPEAKTAPSLVKTFGCFSYAVPEGQHVRLHFRNTEPNDGAPFATDRADQRREELSALFTHAKRTVGRDTPVVGVSWLYNLEAYRRLFPPAYTATARPVPGGFRSMPLWGQFVDRRGQLRAASARAFEKAISEASDLEALEASFPLRALTVRAPVSEFYDFYGI